MPFSSLFTRCYHHRPSFGNARQQQESASASKAGWSKLLLCFGALQGHHSLVLQFHLLSLEAASQPGSTHSPSHLLTPEAASQPGPPPQHPQPSPPRRSPAMNLISQEAATSNPSKLPRASHHQQWNRDEMGSWVRLEGHHRRRPLARFLDPPPSPAPVERRC
jgi:hypothetical protein